MAVLTKVEPFSVLSSQFPVLSSQFPVLGSQFSERKANYTTFSHEELTAVHTPIHRLNGYNAFCV